MGGREREGERERERERERESSHLARWKTSLSKTQWFSSGSLPMRRKSVSNMSVSSEMSVTIE